MSAVCNEAAMSTIRERQDAIENNIWNKAIIIAWHIQLDLTTEDIHCSGLHTQQMEYSTRGRSARGLL